MPRYSLIIESVSGGIPRYDRSARVGAAILNLVEGRKEVGTFLFVLVEVNLAAEVQGSSLA